MKRILTLFLLSSVVFVCILRATPPIDLVQNSTNGITVSKSYRETDFVKQLKSLQTNNSGDRKKIWGDTETGNVTINITPNTANFELSTIKFINSDITIQEDYGYALTEGQDKVKVQVPSGNYLVYACYVYRSDDPLNEVGPSRYHIIHEDVKIEENSEISLLLEEANKTIKFRGKNPDGSNIKIPTLLGINEQTYEAIWDVEGVNTVDMLMSNKIYHEEFGLIAEGGGNAGYDTKNGDLGESNQDILCSSVSDKIYFIQHRLVLDWGTNGFSNQAYSVVFGTNGLYEDKVITNNEIDFINCPDLSFVSTPSSMPWEERDGKITCQGKFLNFINGDYSSIVTHSFTLYGDYPGLKSYVQPDLSASCLNDYIGVSIENLDFDKLVEVEMFPGYVYTELQTAGIKSYPSIYIDGEWRNIYFGNILENKIFINDGGSYMHAFPGNLGFNHSISKIKESIGNNVPIMILTQQKDFFRNITSSHTAEYIGRYGESRSIDNLYLSVQATRNNEVLFDGNYEDLNNWTKSNQSDGHTKGIVEIKYNNRNIQVDDLPGFNETVISYDENRGDVNVPTLQMVQFRNSSDEVTERFNSGEDGLILIAGADYNYNIGFFGLSQVSIKVEYTVHGTNDWYTLEIEEVPEYYLAPAYGYFWTGNFRDVEIESPNGWYDMRISLTDMSGNSQVQTFGPAFKIEKNGTAQVEKVNNLNYIIYDVINKELSMSDGSDSNFKVFTVNGSLISESSNLNNLPSGMYIVEAFTNGGIFSRKIIIK